jgi:hypothetical protein
MSLQSHESEMAADCTFAVLTFVMRSLEHNRSFSATTSTGLPSHGLQDSTNFEEPSIEVNRTQPDGWRHTRHLLRCHPSLPPPCSEQHHAQHGACVFPSHLKSSSSWLVSAVESVHHKRRYYGCAIGIHGASQLRIQNTPYRYLDIANCIRIRASGESELPSLAT